MVVLSVVEQSLILVKNGYRSKKDFAYLRPNIFKNAKALDVAAMKMIFLKLAFDILKRAFH